MRDGIRWMCAWAGAALMVGVAGGSLVALDGAVGVAGSEAGVLGDASGRAPLADPALDGQKARGVSPPGPDALRTVLRLGRDVPVAAAFNKGARYNALVGEAARVTTRFSDAIAVTERSADGGIRTRLTDPGGRALATLSVTRGADAAARLDYQAVGAPVVRAPGRAELTPTLDWAGRQAYAFLQDGVGVPGTPARWRRNLVRPVRAGLVDIDARIAEVRTEWPSGITATARRPVSAAAARGKSGAVITFTTVLEQDGVELGWVRWHQNKRVLAWQFADGTTGYLSPTRLREAGGWPFRPDMAWTNVQAYAFHELPRRMPPPGVGPEPRVGLVQRVLEKVVPTLHAQDGCTGLHWLDGTVFRTCCDQHDLCYNTYGCNRYSWFWPWANGWSCGACNVSAVFCFFSEAGGDDPYI